MILCTTLWNKLLPGDYNAGGPAVVSDGNILPVGHESVLLAPEHDADVGGVVQGRVEVRVVAWGPEHTHGLVVNGEP